MQDNVKQTGSNWTGTSPRTMREAFPQYPDSSYEEPSFLRKTADVMVLVACIGVVCVVIGWAAAFSGVI